MATSNPPTARRNQFFWRKGSLEGVLGLATIFGRVVVACGVFFFDMAVVRCALVLFVACRF